MRKRKLHLDILRVDIIIFSSKNDNIKKEDGLSFSSEKS